MQGERSCGIDIGQDVWIGAGARILVGVTIGDHAVIASGAVATRSVPPPVLLCAVCPPSRFVFAMAFLLVPRTTMNQLMTIAAQRLRDLPVERALARAKLRHARRIPTFTSAAELRKLFRLAKRAGSAARVLEIGSYLGASTCHIAAALGPRAVLTCADTWNNETMPEGVQDTHALFSRNVTPAMDRIRIPVPLHR